MTRTKGIAVILGIAMLAAIGVACGNGAASNSTGETPAPTSQAVVVANEPTAAPPVSGPEREVGGTWDRDRGLWGQIARGAPTSRCVERRPARSWSVLCSVNVDGRGPGPATAGPPYGAVASRH